MFPAPAPAPAPASAPAPAPAPAPASALLLTLLIRSLLFRWKQMELMRKYQKYLIQCI